MTKNFNLKTLAMATAIATTMFAAQASAQNVVTVPATATVQNAITLTQNAPMAYGTIIAINDGAQTATAALATDDTVVFTTTGAPALMAQATGSPTAAEIGVAGVNGATINLTIDSVVNPTDGTDTLTLASFLASVNGAADVTVTTGTPFSYTATAADIVEIGASLTTPAQPVQIGDGLYTGSFDFTASY